MKPLEKKLNFYDPLPDKVLSGEKDTTWRINDDKDLSPGDIILCTNNEREGSKSYPGRGSFARVKVIWTKETTFGELTSEDTAGHEPFPSNKDMYATYSGYYGFQVTPQTRLKVVKYRLIEKL